MSKDDRELIERLRGLLAKASALPWEISGVRSKADIKLGYNSSTHSIGPDGDAVAVVFHDDLTGLGFIDGKLIVEAVNALPALLTRLEALQAQPVGEAVIRAEDVDEIVRHACESASDDRNGEYFIIRPDALLKAAGEIAALIASPPVVEREAIARIIDPREWDEAETYRVRADEWFAKGRTEPGDALTDGYRRKADEMQAKLLAKADAILALTPVEGAGELTRLRAALIEAGRNAGCLLADDVSTDFLMHVPEEVRLKLSTPVAQGDEVRDALEPNLRAVMAVINDMRRAGEKKWADRVQDALEGPCA